MPDHVHFIKDATDIEIKSYSYPAETDTEKFQVDLFTAGGTKITQELAPDKTVLVLTFLGLSDAEVASLRTFFDTTINGSQYSFTFRDCDAGETEYTVYWMDKIFDPKKVTYDTNTLVMRLMTT